MKNKLVALGLMVVGMIPVLAFHDATVLVFVTIISTSLFFSKENMII